MRFTASKDGTARCTVVLRVRLTRDEWEELCQAARRQGRSPHEVAELEADLAVHGYIEDPDSRTYLSPGS